MYWQGVKKQIVPRPYTQSAALGDIDPLLQRIFTSRGIKTAIELETGLNRLPSPWLLKGMREMVDCLVAALTSRKNICIVADFDADGATSCALAVKGLTLLGGKRPQFITPNRFTLGYGLTPEIVALVKQKNVDIILTVDNGISSISGVAAAKSLGMQVLITDHHLPGDVLPAADAIVNPNLAGDNFPSRNTVSYTHLTLPTNREV